VQFVSARYNECKKMITIATIISKFRSKKLGQKVSEFRLVEKEVRYRANAITFA